MKKYLVHLPADPERLFLAIPFFMNLQEKITEEDELNLIGPKEIQPFLKFFPSKGRFFELTDKKGMLARHHYAYNLLDVFNIDYYFDLEGDAVSNATGFLFRSKKRFGVFESFLGKFFLGKRIDSREIDFCWDKAYLDLYKAFDPDHPAIPLYKVKNVLSNVESLEGPTLILLTKTLDASFFPFDEFLSQYEDGKIIWYYEEEPEDRDEEYDPSLDRSKITIKKLLASNPKELFQQIILAKVVLSDTPYWALWASMVGVPTMFFSEKEQNRAYLPTMFDHTPLIAKYQEGEYQIMGSDGFESVESESSIIQYLQELSTSPE